MPDNLSPKLPCDLEAERIVLGSLILGNIRTAEIFDLLGPEDFFDVRHANIYRVMKNMWESNESVDLPLLMARLNASGKVEDVGGIGYAASLIDGIPLKMKADEYAAVTRKKRILRELIHGMQALQNSAFDADASGIPASDVVDLALETITRIGNLAASENRGTSQHDAACSLVFSLNEVGTVPIASGMRTLDDNVGGFRAGELTIITAETGVGKTHFALQIARASCLQSRHTLYCSGEMLAPHLMGRILAGESNVPYNRIRRPEFLSSDEGSRLREVAIEQCTHCKILDGELTLASIRMAARSMQKTLGCVFVDYDELVEVRGKDEWDMQRILIRSLKSLAMELKVPVIVVSQLRKALNDQDRQMPTLQRLYGSGAKAKHASIVIYIDRPYVQDLQGDETEATIFILKSRDGKMGKIPCRFNVRTFRLEETHADVR